MRHLTQVIKNTVTPSSMRGVPSNFGDAAAGSVKADEWRTMFTIYIPIALVTLWGTGSSLDKPNSEREALDHTMALASAITLACKNTMTVARAADYRECVKTWLQDLQRLYPHISGRPNNHMALHIYEFLLLFGPVRSWWCFPFERVNGQLQRQPSNHKFGKPLYGPCPVFSNTYLGQLESTLLYSFIRASRLRRWLARIDCPPAIRECKILFDKVYSHNRDECPNASSGDDNNSCHRLVPVPDDLRHLVSDNKVVLMARHQHGGIRFSRSSTHLGNSLIQFYPAEQTSSETVPGCIKYIYRAQTGVSFAVQRHPDVSPDTANPWVSYPHFPVRLYSTSLADKLESVKPDQVISHFVRYQLSPEHTLVLSLDAVSQTQDHFFRSR